MLLPIRLFIYCLPSSLAWRWSSSRTSHINCGQQLTRQSLLLCSTGCHSLEIPLRTAWIHITSFLGARHRYGILMYIDQRMQTSNRNTVWRYLHFHSTWKENHCLSGTTRQRIHIEWKASSRECRRNLQPLDHTCVRAWCGIRLLQFKIDGAEKG